MSFPISFIIRDGVGRGGRRQRKELVRSDSGWIALLSLRFDPILDGLCLGHFQATR